MLILGLTLKLKKKKFSSYLAKQTTNQLKILKDAEFFINVFSCWYLIMQIRVLTEFAYSVYTNMNSNTLFMKKNKAFTV